MVNKWLNCKLIALFFVCGCASGVEQFSPPEALVQKLSQTVTEHLQAIPIKERTSERVSALMREVVLPHFNLEEMAQRIIGATWQTAAESLKQQFKIEFTQMMINTYAAAFKAYRGEEVRLLPLRGAVKSPLKIDSELKLKNGTCLEIQYALKLQDSRWYVYDFSINGVSIVNNYREQFAGTLRQQGLSGLIRQMQLKAAVRR